MLISIPAVAKHKFTLGLGSCCIRVKIHVVGKAGRRTHYMLCTVYEYGMLSTYAMNLHDIKVRVQNEVPIRTLNAYTKYT